MVLCRSRPGNHHHNEAGKEKVRDQQKSPKFRVGWAGEAGKPLIGVGDGGQTDFLVAG